MSTTDVGMTIKNSDESASNKAFSLCRPKSCRHRFSTPATVPYSKIDCALCSRALPASSQLPTVLSAGSVLSS